MAVDASIPLSTNPAATAGPDVGKMVSLAEMAQKMKIEQQKQAGQNALKTILSDPGAYDAKTGGFTPQAIRATAAIDPGTALDLRQADLDARVKQAQEQHYQTEAGKTRWDILSGLAGVGADAYDAAKKAGKNEQDAQRAGIEARNEAARNTGGALSNQDVDGILAAPFDPMQVKSFAMSNSDYSKRAKEAAEAAAARDREAETIRHNQVEERIQSRNAATSEGDLSLRRDKQELDKTGSPKDYGQPGEVEYTDKDGKVRRLDAVYDPKNGRYLSAVGFKPIEGSDFRPIKGGEAGMGNRAEVMFNRVTSAANEATAAARNIMELPVTTTRGVFGGRSQGHGLFEAAKEDLANKVTGQEAQDYNTMLAGVGRNLAAIEGAGLAPSGSLTHSMDALAIKEGDTNITKLRKMAEMRQIVERGIEPNLANPKIPVEEKDMVKNIVQGIQEAIPFTQHDITMFERNGKASQTFGDYAKKVEATKDVPSGVDPDLWKHMTPDERALWQTKN